MKIAWFSFAFAFLTLAANPAAAASFYIQEQSVSAMGTAFAGAVADTPDASTVFYNPAGMTDLDAAQAVIGGNLILPRAKFKNTGSSVSSTVGTAAATVPMAGGNGGNPFKPAGVPQAYFAFPLNTESNWWGGLGVSVPFGLSNQYDRDFVGRYDSTENFLQVIDVSPSLAYAPAKWISLGVGFNVQHAEATLKSALPSSITAGGPVPGTDGSTDLSGDDISTGFNAGIIVKPREGTRIGAHYRQGVSHTLKGRLITQVPLDVPGIGGTISNVQGSAELDLPSMASFAVSQAITENLTLLASINWYKWSNFNDIPVQLANGSGSQAFQNYKNTWGFALGARYKLNDAWTLKAGVQYDQTPTVDNFRSTRIPDGDRAWIAGGASYEINDRLVLDMAAIYVDVAEENINLTDTVPIGASSTTYNISGQTEGDVGIVSAALRYKF